MKTQANKTPARVAAMALPDFNPSTRGRTLAAYEVEADEITVEHWAAVIMDSAKRDTAAPEGCEAWQRVIRIDYVPGLAEYLMEHHGASLLGRQLIPRKVDSMMLPCDVYVAIGGVFDPELLRQLEGAGAVREVN